MKIGIDVSSIVYGTGVSVYTENLVKSFSEIDNKNEYKLYGGSLRRKEELEGFYKSINKKNFRGIAYPFPPTFMDFLWNGLHRVNIETFIGSVDVFHSSDWTQPPTNAYKVTTIHDLVPVLYPEWSHPRIVANFHRRLKWVKEEVDEIISVSESTKNDLIRFGFSKNKITVIPEAPDKKLKQASNNEVEKIKAKYKLCSEYLLAIGVTERKNTKRIVKSYMKLRGNKLKGKQLVIIGYPYMQIDKLSGVKILGHVNSKDMPALYTGASVLVYPSLYEGFGLPILEAMSCGVPVVTSKTSSMKDISGDAAVLVDPESVRSIATGILNAIENKKSLKVKGLKQSKMYSWEGTARATLKIYYKSK